MTERPGFNEDINLMRGLGIVLVVLGHSFELVLDSPGWMYAKQVIYSFHMPVFFFVSGFLGKKFFVVERGKVLSVIARQAKRLLSVYVFCTLLVVPGKMILSAYSARPLPQESRTLLADILVYPGNHPMIVLWFVFTLFVMQILILLMNRLVRIPYHRAVWAGIMLAGFYGLHVLSCHIGMTEIWCLGRVAYYAVFFVMGYLFVVHQDRLSPRLLSVRPLLLVSSLVVLLGAPAVTHAALALSLGTPDFSHPMLGFPLAAIGIAAVWAAATLIRTGAGRCKAIMDIMAKYSYDIYLYSYFAQAAVTIGLFKMLDLPLQTSPALLLGIGLVLPILVSKYMLRPVPFLRRWALGDWSTKASATAKGID